MAQDRFQTPPDPNKGYKIKNDRKQNCWGSRWDNPWRAKPENPFETCLDRAQLDRAQLDKLVLSCRWPGNREIWELENPEIWDFAPLGLR